MVLARSLSNSTPSPLKRAIRAYRALDLTRPLPDRPVQKPKKRVIQLNAKQVRHLIERYETGATVYELANEFQINRRTVSDHLKAEGVRMRMQSLAISQVEEAIRLYSSGVALAEVGRLLGVHASTVSLALTREGVRMRNPWDRPRRQAVDQCSNHDDL